MIVRSIKFLVGFGATVMILLALWYQYGHYYIATLLPLANSLIGMENLPLGLVYDGEHMAISYLDVEGQWRNGELKGHELVYLNMIAAIALNSRTSRKFFETTFRVLRMFCGIPMGHSCVEPVRRGL